ncbi:MAG TPA: hypothetical protein DDX54_06720 [Rhodospirillaceae bacterium]|mgnify:CR=1 FL=1|jgi:hypothetical protein|nr:hypothetical protein [Alphaproteobacteria bacterium]HBH27076.1 hypothetical protein [Rhodospirillaceae bacterium]
MRRAALFAALLFLAACAGRGPNLPEAQYWQRVAASDAAYTQGPKAQDMLSRDIARCVAELRELERMGMLRGAIPADPMTGRVLDPNDPRRELQDWEAPDRTGFLRAEMGDYQDFEGCMIHKGWERVEYLPYGESLRAQESYVDSLWESRHKRPSDSYPPPPPGGYQTQVNG